MRAYARRKQCKDSQKLNGYKKLPCILRENFIGEPGRYVWHKKGVPLYSNPLLTLNLYYENTLQRYGLFRTFARVSGIKCVFVTLIIFYAFVLHPFLKLEACC